MQQVLEDVSREKESLELHLNEVSCRYAGGIHGMYTIVHLCTCKHVHLHVNTCKHVHLHVNTCKHVHLHVLHVYMYSVLYMCTQCICMYMYTCTFCICTQYIVHLLQHYMCYIHLHVRVCRIYKSLLAGFTRTNKKQEKC